MFGKRRKTEDFSAELAAHIALEADRLRAAEGLGEPEAYARARKTFGNVTRTEERFYEANRWQWLENLVQDARYAVRQLSKDKSFTLIVTATLSLGIAATVAIFSLVDATLLRALPYRQAERVISIGDTRIKGHSSGGLTTVARFFDVQARNTSFANLTFLLFDVPTLIVGSSPPLPVSRASGNGEFWETIGVPPLLGRTFTKRDDQPNAPPVAVISYALWQTAFGGDSGVLNRQVQLDGKATTIIGVLRHDLQYPNRIEIWTPAQFDPAKWTYRGNGTRFISMLARLKPGVSFEAAQRDLRTIGEQLRREHADTDGEWQFSSESLREDLYGAWKPALLVLLAASGVLLLIACVNVANLLLSRGSTRGREMALRLALGASRRRILTQLFTESILLALLGGMAGVVASLGLVRALAVYFSGRLSGEGLSLDWRVGAFAFLVSVATGILFGMAPALQSARAEGNARLKQGDGRTGGAAGGSLRNAFVSTQVALSFLLIVGASLLGESLWFLLNAPLGFHPEQVLTFEIDLPWNAEPAMARHFFDDLQKSLEAMPGVTAVGQITALPTVDWHWRNDFDVDWQPRTTHQDAVNVEARHIAGRYWEAMKIPLLAGRRFTERDVADEKTKSGVVLVNQEFVRQYSAAVGNPLGRHLINDRMTFEIVGVVGDVRGTAGSLAQPVGPEVYFPLENHGQRTFVMRAVAPPEALIRAIREQVRRLDATQALRDVALLQERIEKSVAQPRFNMGLLASFAVVALLLACVGIYGVVSYAVTQKSVEIGIRMALGAGQWQVAMMFVRRAMTAAGVGLALGGLAAVGLTQLMRSELYGVQPGDPRTYLLAALALLAPVALASLWPASKAAGVNAVELLRRD